MREYEAAVALIQQHPTLQSFVGARSSTAVEAAERALGRKFPPTYRRFLREYGAGGFGSDDFYGVIDDDFENSAVPDAVWMTLTERRQAGLPAELVEIFGTGSEEVFCLDLGIVQSDGESPIVAYYPGYPVEAQTKELTANDFGEFLLARVQRQLARRE